MEDSLAKAKSLLLKLRPWHFIAAFCLILAAFTVLWTASRIKFVTIDVDGAKTEITTLCPDPYEILDRQGVELGAYDKVTYTNIGTPGFFGELGKNEAVIRVQTAVKVGIRADGLKYHISVGEGDTLEDAVEVSGLTLSEHDLISPDLQVKAQNGDEITVTRIEYREVTEEETIPRGKQYKGTSLRGKGKTFKISTGRDGLLEKTYREKYVDGVLDERVLLSEEVVKTPVDNWYVVGDGSVISPMDLGFNIVNDRPTSYVTVYENVRATGYSAKPGTLTATGRKAQVGHVAVDPRIIPYGSKLWIVAHSESSSFVYGYAIAADTGTGMLAGINFVDLFYDTYYESVLNGLRKVDVYVLEIPETPWKGYMP